VAGQLIERGDKVWLVRVFIGKMAGKRKYINRTVRGTKKEAQAVLTKMLHDRDTGILAAPSRRSVAEYLQEWQHKALRGRVTPRTYTVYVDHLKRYVLLLRPANSGGRQCQGCVTRAVPNVSRKSWRMAQPGTLAELRGSR